MHRMQGLSRVAGEGRRERAVDVTYAREVGGNEKEEGAGVVVNIAEETD
jgi:hypothetical protein